MTLVRPVAEVDEVAALWESLVRHHYEVNPAIGRQARPVGSGASWPGRRRQYEAWSAEPGWLMVVAERDGVIRGYAAARVVGSTSAWDFGERVGRLESLAVEPAARGTEWERP
nr:GNAT family N-acetyltransferase [uncultured Actinoplanes sp.]